MVGAEALTSFVPGSEECDAYMTTYCNTPEFAYSKECACIVDEAKLRREFCEPGSTATVCADNTSLASALPVTCFGKNCSNGGYRWQRMLRQKCTITLCEQVVNLLGDDIVIKGGSKLYCGNREIDVAPVSVSPTDSTSGTAATPITIPEWLWLIIAMAIFLVIIVVPISVIILRRYYQDLNEIL